MGFWAPHLPCHLSHLPTIPYYYLPPVPASHGTFSLSGMPTFPPLSSLIHTYATMSYTYAYSILLNSGVLITLPAAVYSPPFSCLPAYLLPPNYTYLACSPYREDGGLLLLLQEKRRRKKARNGRKKRKKQCPLPATPYPCLLYILALFLQPHPRVLSRLMCLPAVLACSLISGACLGRKISDLLWHFSFSCLEEEGDRNTYMRWVFFLQERTFCRLHAIPMPYALRGGGGGSAWEEVVPMPAYTYPKPVSSCLPTYACNTHLYLRPTYSLLPFPCITGKRSVSYAFYSLEEKTYTFLHTYTIPWDGKRKHLVCRTVDRTGYAFLLLEFSVWWRIPPPPPTLQSLPDVTCIAMPGTWDMLWGKGCCCCAWRQEEFALHCCWHAGMLCCGLLPFLLFISKHVPLSLLFLAFCTHLISHLCCICL